MYSLHPAGVPGGVWAGGGAVDDSDVVQSGWRSRLSTSFRAHWGGGRGSPLPPSPLSFAPIMAIPSPAFGRKSVCTNISHLEQARGGFLPLFWFVFFHINEFSS